MCLKLEAPYIVVVVFSFLGFVGVGCGGVWGAGREGTGFVGVGRSWSKRGLTTNKLLKPTVGLIFALKQCIMAYRYSKE